MREAPWRLLVVLLSAVCTSCTTRDVRSVDSAGVDHERATVELYPATLLARIGDSLSRGRATGSTLNRHPTFFYIEGRRVSTGVPEVHDGWTDIALVQAGHATLLTGGRVDGSHVESPGEHRGGNIIDGTSRPVGAGDLLVIPAGTAHQFMISTGDSLRYLTVKVAAVAR